MKELILAVLLMVSALSGAEPEHDPETRTRDMAEMAGMAAAEAYETPLAPEYAAYVVEVCEGYGLDPAVVFGVMQQESGFRTAAVGDNGKALGIMQVQPRWHADRMARLGVTDLLDEWQAVWVGCDYLAELLEEHGGDYRTALTVYRYGTTAATAEDYAGIVLRNAENIRR